MTRLINTLDEIREYAKVSRDLSFESLTPGLNEVELNEFNYYIGASLYNVIIAESENGNISERIAAIHPYLKTALSNLGVYYSLAEIEVNISDNGIIRNETTNEKTAYNGQIHRLKESLANRGYKAIDNCITIIETNAAQYPEWQASEYSKVKAQLLFSSAADFSRHESIKDSPMTFHALIPFIRQAQEQVIKKHIPREMYLNMISSSIEEENKQILNEFIKPALAALSMYTALNELPVSVDYFGVTVNQLELSGADNITKKTASDSALIRKREAIYNKWKQYLSDMSEYLNNQASESSFHTWFSSSFYSEPLSVTIKKNKLDECDRNVFRA